jgi:hypothetical protein
MFHANNGGKEGKLLTKSPPADRPVARSFHYLSGGRAGF